MRLAIVLFLSVCLFACHDINELYVHPNCPEWVYGEVEMVLVELSDKCGEDFESRLIGISDEVDSYMDVIVCGTDTIPKCSGWASESGDIWIDDTCSDGFTRWAIRHELGHYLGADDISGENLMNHVRQTSQYTDVDIEEICGE